MTPRREVSRYPLRRCEASPERGQATVEFALLLPLMLGLTIGVVQVGLVVRAQMLVVQAAREAARNAAVGGDQTEAVAAGQRATSLGRGPLSVTVVLAEPGGEVVATARYPLDVGVPGLGFTRRVVVESDVAMRREY